MSPTRLPVASVRLFVLSAIFVDQNGFNSMVNLPMIIYYCLAFLPPPTRTVMLYWTVLAGAIAPPCERIQRIFFASRSGRGLRDFV